MPQFLSWLAELFSSWKFWIVISPWDVGVRIRLGAMAVALKPGLNFRIPFIDTIIVVNTRLRVTGTPQVTIKGSSGRVSRSLMASVGYKIHDPLKAMMNFGAPDMLVSSRAQVEMSRGESEVECLAALKQYFSEDTGVAVDFLSFVEDVEVRTYRLLNSQSYTPAGHDSSFGMAGGVERY